MRWDIEPPRGLTESQQEDTEITDLNRRSRISEQENTDLKNEATKPTKRDGTF
jgi:hypothetical protein